MTIALIIRAVNNALDGCPTPPDPTQPGPFGVGVRQITFTKPSETRPGEDRVLLTDIWYPTPPTPRRWMLISAASSMRHGPPVR